MKAYLLCILFGLVHATRFTQPFPDTWGGYILKKGGGAYNMTEKFQYVKRGNVEAQIYSNSQTTVLSFADNGTQYTVTPSACICAFDDFLMSSAIDLEKTDKTCKSPQGENGTLYQGLIVDNDLVSTTQACVHGNTPYYWSQQVQTSTISFSLLLGVLQSTNNPDPEATRSSETLPAHCYSVPCGREPPSPGQELAIPSFYKASYTISKDGAQISAGDVVNSQEGTYVFFSQSDQTSAKVWSYANDTQLYAPASNQFDTCFLRTLSVGYNVIGDFVFGAWFYVKSDETCVSSKGDNGSLWKWSGNTICSSIDGTVLYSLSSDDGVVQIDMFEALDSAATMPPVIQPCLNPQ